MDNGIYFFQNLEKGVKDACDDFGFKYTMLDQKADATQMVQDLNTLVNQKVSGIVCTPVDPGAMGPAVQKQEMQESQWYVLILENQGQ